MYKTKLDKFEEMLTNIKMVLYVCIMLSEIILFQMKD